MRLNRLSVASRSEPAIMTIVCYYRARIMCQCMMQSTSFRLVPGIEDEERVVARCVSRVVEDQSLVRSSRAHARGSALRRHLAHHVVEQLALS